MAARSISRLPASRRSEPAHREQRQQKVEECLSRKKTFSGIPIQENEPSISNSRARRATSKKLQDKIQLSTSSKPEMENKENANKISWDQSSETSLKNTILNSSTLSLTNSLSGTNCKPEDCASKDEVTEIKSRHMSLSKTFLQLKRIKEKQLIAEKQNSNASLPKKAVLGIYRGKIVQSKINSFRKAPRSGSEKSPLPDKKLLPSATTKTASKPSDKASTGLQSDLKKCQPTCAVALKKVTAQKISEKQPSKAASTNSDQRVPGVKKHANFLGDARPEAPAKPISVVADTKSGQNSKTNGNRKPTLPKEATKDRRACLDEWRTSKGKVMRRPPISVLLGPQSKSKREDLSSGNSSEDVLHSEKVNKTLTVCLQLAEQGCQGDEVCAMLEELTQSIPGTKKLAKYWICCMHLEQTGPLENLITVYEEAILAGAMPKDELRHALIETLKKSLKNTESLFKSEDALEGTAIEAHFSEAVEVKELNSSVDQVQEAFKDLCYDDDDQKQESVDKTVESGNEVIKKEKTDLGLTPSEKILPKKNKRHKTKERRRKKVKYEVEKQKEDEVKDVAQEVNSPEKNDTPCLMSYNPSATPYLESVKMQDEANDFSDKDVITLTPSRYSQRIREKIYQMTDAVKDQDPCLHLNS